MPLSQTIKTKINVSGYETYNIFILFTAWKPSQTGAKMATNTMLVMTGAALFPEELEQHLPSVLPSFIPEDRMWMARVTGETPSLNPFFTGRISTDANENLHAQLRANNVIHPSAKTCRARLKAIALSQYDGKGLSSEDNTMIDYIDNLALAEEPVEIPELPAQAIEEQPLPVDTRAGVVLPIRMCRFR